MATLAGEDRRDRRRLHRARHDDQGRRLARRRFAPSTSTSWSPSRGRARAPARRRLAVVSALGADRRSRVFYNRVKGEMEDAVTGLGYESVVIARPVAAARRSRVARPADATPARSGRRACSGRCCRSCRQACDRSLRRWLPRRLVATLDHAEPGTRVLSSADLQRSAAADVSAVAALRPHPHARFLAARLPRRQLLTPLDPGQAVAPRSRAASSGSCAADRGRRRRAPRSRARRGARSRESGSAPTATSTSAKLGEQRAFVGVGRSVRRPGVSMMQAPPGSRCSERAVVVCMPRLSCTRTAPVSWTAAPSSVLVRVDLPAPDEPSTTSVRPKPVRCANAGAAWPDRCRRRRRPRRRAGRRARSCAEVRVAPTRVGGGDVGLAQHDHRRDATGHATSAR